MRKEAKTTNVTMAIILILRLFTKYIGTIAVENYLLLIIIKKRN